MADTISQRNVCRFGNLTIWSERGYLRIVDERTGQYEVVNVYSSLHRINALQEMLRNSLAELRANDRLYGPTFETIQRMIEEVDALIRLAREQGTPDDPSACRDLARRRARSVLVPSANWGA